MSPPGHEELPLPRVSVIMACYNARPFLLETVRSVLSQSVTELELLLVDDASTDGSTTVLAGLEDPRLQVVILDRNQGPSEARNRALVRARAPLVAVCDADDVCEPTRLERQMAYLRDHADVDVVGSQITVIDEAGRCVGTRSYPLTHAEIMRAMPAWCPLAHSTVMYRRDAVVGAGGYQTSRRMAEDYELWSRLAVSGLRFANLSQRLVRYRVHVQAAKLHSARPLILATLDIKRRYWYRRFRLPDVVRALQEMVLLALPQRLVWRLFIAIEYGQDRATSAKDTLVED